MTVPDHRGLQRIVPAIPTALMRTYQMTSPQVAYPVSAANCERFGCASHAHGWRTVVDERLDLGQRQAHYIRTQSGRRFTERRREDGLTEFTFEAGQACFKQHKLPAEGAERFIRRGGDWRGNPTGEVYEHARPDDWVEDFAEHQDRIQQAIERG